jgi:hypothetical protein
MMGAESSNDEARAGIVDVLFPFEAIEHVNISNHT